jgi:hypothetical protein
MSEKMKSSRKHIRASKKGPNINEYNLKSPGYEDYINVIQGFLAKEVMVNKSANGE